VFLCFLDCFEGAMASLEVESGSGIKVHVFSSSSEVENSTPHILFTYILNLYFMFGYVFL
jgi:hypothetical protein